MSLRAMRCSSLVGASTNSDQYDFSGSQFCVCRYSPLSGSNPRYTLDLVTSQRQGILLLLLLLLLIIIIIIIIILPGFAV
jgi:hypothetical protein